MKNLRLSLFIILIMLIIFGGFLFIQEDYISKDDLNNEENNKEINFKEEIDISEKYEFIEGLKTNFSSEEKEDLIALVAKRDNEESIFKDELKLIIKSGEEKKEYSLNDFNGYNPKMEIKDFTGDHNKEIFLKAATGGSGGIYNHLIIAYDGEDFKKIFDEDDNRGVEANGYFGSDFTAHLYFENLDKEVDLDISANKEAYIEDNIYNKDGKMVLRNLIRPYSNPFSLLEAIDYDGDNIYELRGKQRIVGAYGADTISEIESIWKYKDGKWVIEEANYSTYIKR
ncbi:MAG: hypothetical protein ACQEQF_02225 [Bacillota bacterium]